MPWNPARKSALTLLAGPGAITTVILYAQRHTSPIHDLFIGLAIALVALSLWGAVRAAPYLASMLGRLGINIVTRIMGLTMASIGVEFMAKGMKQLFPALSQRRVPLTGNPFQGRFLPEVGKEGGQFFAPEFSSMDGNMKKREETCSKEAKADLNFRQKLPAVADSIIDHCEKGECFTHVAYEPIPSREAVIRIISKFREILFPGYFSAGRLDPVNLRYNMGQLVSTVFDELSEQVAHSIRHDCFRYDQQCLQCTEEGNRIALEVLEAIPGIRRIIATDVRGAYEGDPAAKSYDEIIFSYPGIYAIMVYRIAHVLHEHKVPLLPRIMTEYAHSVTGIDIHPGASIGESFVIDHGTGVVIGETTEIGKNVRIYQGVTLGALSLPKDAGAQLRDKKRHPTIEDDVIIYAGSTILGGNTVIGARAVIGGNVWLTESVPPDTKVLVENPRLIYRQELKRQRT